MRARLFSCAIVASLCTFVVPMRGTTQEAGHWTVAIDPLDELNNGADEGLKQHNLPFIVVYRQLNVTPADRAGLSDAEKASALSQWVDQIGQEMTKNHFDEVSDEELRAHSGMSIEDMRNKIIGAMPFGGRAEAEAHMGHDIHVFLNQRSACTREGGMLMAMDMEYEPTPGAVHDYGYATFAVIGALRCGSRATSYAEEHIKDIANEIAEDVKYDIEIQ